MSKNLRVEKIVKSEVVLVKNCVVYSVTCLMSNDKVESRKYTFSLADTNTMRKAQTFKEFTAVANKSIAINALRLDAESRKQNLCRNTRYDATHTKIARVLNKVNFVASNDRRKVEVKKAIVKVAKAKAKKQVAKVAKKTSAK